MKKGKPSVPRAVITITHEDGNIHVTVQFTPATPTSGKAPVAHAVAVKALQAISEFASK